MSLTATLRSTAGTFRPRLAPRVETAPAPGPTSGGGGSRRYQMLDVWRGLICLFVVLEHAGVTLWDRGAASTRWDAAIRDGIAWILTLNIGTSLFFVISGYCIAASIESSRRKGQGPLKFLARRLWRIFPTYWAALLGFVLIVGGLDLARQGWLHQHGHGLGIGSPQTLTLAQWLGNLTLTETWRPWLGGGHSDVFTRVAWSLCFQEQFYAVCCLVLWLTPGRMYRALAWVTTAVVGYRVFLWDVGAVSSYQGTFLYAWHEFAVGLAVHWRLNAGMKATPTDRRLIEALLAALACVGIATGYRSTAAAGTFGLVLIALHRWDALAGRQSWLEPLRACGRRSFSVYLAHLPVVVVCNGLLFQYGVTGYWTRALVMVPLSMAAAVAASWAFHRHVESHFLGAPPAFGEIFARRLRPLPVAAAQVRAA